MRHNDGGVPYIGVFSRAGYLREHYDKGYLTTNTFYREIQYSGGLLSGILFTNIYKRLSIDVNIGIYYKHKYIKRNFYEDNRHQTQLHNYGNMGFRVGLNLYLWK